MPEEDELVTARSVAERLDHVESKPALVYDAIDFTVRDPAGLAAELAAPLEYAQRVEAVVAAGGIESLMPRRDERVDRFLAVWTEDEQGHATALGTLMELLGMTPHVVADTGLPPHNHVVGALGRLSAKFHEVVVAVWATAGAMNEHLAMTAYARMDVMLQARDEQALHETLFRRLRAHESAHKSFYAAYAAETLARLVPWQRRLARAIVEHTYAPVGAGAKRDRPPFARTVRTLAAGEWEQTLVEPVQTVAERLLNDAEPMEPFVRRAVVKCLVTDPMGIEAITLAEHAA